MFQSSQAIKYCADQRRMWHELVFRVETDCIFRLCYIESYSIKTTLILTGSHKRFLSGRLAGFVHQFEKWITSLCTIFLPNKVIQPGQSIFAVCHWSQPRELTTVASLLIMVVAAYQIAALSSTKVLPMKKREDMGPFSSKLKRNTCKYKELTLCGT